MPRPKPKPARVQPPDRTNVAGIVWVFLRLGATAFGGPAAHVALMRHEFVRRRAWLDDRRFMDLLGVTQLIPGPNSTEMAMHVGYLRAGWRGLVGAGVGFILPAALLVTAFAWAYAGYAATPQLKWLLYGVRPVVIAVVAHAVLGLARASVRPWPMLAVAVGVAVPALLGVSELALLAAGAAAGAGAKLAVARNWPARLDGWAWLAPLVGPSALAVASATPFTLLGLALTFLKIGAVLYGSGYVLVAFLRGEFVLRLGWLTETQVLDAIAIGQVTPGPLFTSATFVGYVLGGFGGAAIATAAIFAPSFAFVAATAPFVARLRRSPLAGALLDGVNAAALGLMASATALLGRQSIVDVLTALTAVAALVVLWRWRLSSIWLIAAGGMVGLVARVLGG
ncbi:MAG: chromate efflux transporter [Actinobacteria bacterium]|nr:chromate efflux transporter [Actinomycetota bacterium]